MHGLVFVELKRYVDATFGGETWNALLDAAKVGTRLHLANQVYPDADLVAIAGAASAATGKGVPAILEGFGEFVAPSLLKVYGMFVRPEWKTLEVIENTEATIHRVVRMKNPGAAPPELKCERKGPGTVVVRYGSARRMCGLAKGIIRGLAAHYKERVETVESSCMLEGASECVLSVRRN